MAWNYEKGCEELAPYDGSDGGPVSCAPPAFLNRGCLEILAWEKTEAAWHRDRNWRTGTVMPGVIAVWERAEIALIGWDERSRREDFRRGYIDWLAGSSGAMDSMSDLEIDALPLLDRIVARGYRELAKTEHPDVGGSDERFTALRKAKAQLDTVLREVGQLLENE